MENPEPRPTPYADLDDAALVALCLERDQDAWRALLERFSRLIYAVAYRRGADSDLAEEVFQSVTTTLVERLHLIDDPMRLPKWLIVTTARRCRELAIARRRAIDPPASAIDEPVEPLSVEDHMVREEMRCQVASALDQLSDRDREILCDLFVKNLSYTEVAARHGLAIGSLGSLRARALKRLRTALEKDGFL